jgi:hypothetical protein
MKNDTQAYVTRLLAVVMKKYGATPFFKVIVKKNGDITVSVILDIEEEFHVSVLNVLNCLQYTYQILVLFDCFLCFVFVLFPAPPNS